MYSGSDEDEGVAHNSNAPNAVETAGLVEDQAEAQVLEVAVVATDGIVAAEAEVASVRATKYPSHAQSTPVQLWNGIEWRPAP